MMQLWLSVAACLHHYSHDVGTVWLQHTASAGRCTLSAWTGRLRGAWIRATMCTQRVDRRRLCGACVPLPSVLFSPRAEVLSTHPRESLDRQDVCGEPWQRGGRHGAGACFQQVPILSQGQGNGRPRGSWAKPHCNGVGPHCNRDGSHATGVDANLFAYPFLPVTPSITRHPKSWLNA